MNHRLNAAFNSYVIEMEHSGGNSGSSWEWVELYVITTDEQPNQFNTLESETTDRAEAYVKSTHSCERAAYDALIDAEMAMA